MKLTSGENKMSDEKLFNQIKKASEIIEGYKKGEIVEIFVNGREWKDLSEFSNSLPSLTAFCNMVSDNAIRIRK